MDGIVCVVKCRQTRKWKESEKLLTHSALDNVQGNNPVTGRYQSRQQYSCHLLQIVHRDGDIVLLSPSDAMGFYSHCSEMASFNSHELKKKKEKKMLYHHL